MKKSKRIYALAAILLVCALVFAACGGNKPPQPENPPPAKITEGDVCIDLNITKMPTKLEYKSGEKFSPAGLVFDAVYKNGFDGDKNLTGGDLDGWSPRGVLNSSVTEMTLLFEGFEKKLPITVADKKLLGMEITREPDITAYSLGDPLDLSGLVVKASYEEGDVDNEVGYTITDKEGKEYVQGTVLDEAVKDLHLTVTLKVGEITKTDTFVIHVYGGITVQAEDVVKSGDTAPTDASYTTMKGKGEVKTDCTWTGTGYIGSIEKGFEIEFYIYSEGEIPNADLVLLAASTVQDLPNNTMLDMQFNKFCKVYVGEENEEVYIDDDIVIPGKPFPEANSGGNKWTNWADVPFGKIDIKKGFNKVKVVCIGGIPDSSNYPRTPNIDRLDVRLSDDDPDVVTRGDVCTDIVIKTAPSKLSYKEGEFFSPDGIVFDAVYKNGYDGDVNLGANRLTWTPSGELTKDDTFVMLKFKTFEKKLDISVRETQLISVEAESTLASGAETPESESYTVISGKNKIEPGKGLNGSASVSDVNVGTKIDFYVYSEQAVQNAELVFVAASLKRGSGFTEDLKFNQLFKLSVDDVEITVPDDVLVKGKTQGNGESIWFLWTKNLISEIDLKAGFTKITIECIATINDSGIQRAANIDKIEIRY